MPTSAPGSKPRWRARPLRGVFHHGFTLIELLVVVALIAIASATLALALRDPAQAELEQEAERLSALLETARAEARASGLEVRWTPLPVSGNEAADQFRFTGLPPSQKLPTRWLHTAPAAAVEGGAAFLQLGPEPLLPAQAVVLSRGEYRLRLASDGLRPFEVVRE